MTIKLALALAGMVLCLLGALREHMVGNREARSWALMCAIWASIVVLEAI